MKTSYTSSSHTHPKTWTEVKENEISANNFMFNIIYIDNRNKAKYTTQDLLSSHERVTWTEIGVEKHKEIKIIEEENVFVITLKSLSHKNLSH